VQFSARNPLVHPLVRRVEPACVPDHADEPGPLLCLVDTLRIGPGVGERDLDLHVLAGLEALQGLLRVNLRRCAENRGADARLRESLAEIPGRWSMPCFCQLASGVELRPTNRRPRPRR
jgi:hypothetical protein